MKAKPLHNGRAAGNCSVLGWGDWWVLCALSWGSLGDMGQCQEGPGTHCPISSPSHAQSIPPVPPILVLQLRELFCSEEGALPPAFPP